MFYNRFPYTDLQQKNLDWMIQTIKDGETAVENKIAEADTAIENAEAATEAANTAKTGADDAATAANNAATAANNAKDAANTAAAHAEETAVKYGTPYATTTAAGMTDHTKIYVYTGTEVGYTAGNWYYWNGTAWTSGGVYVGDISDAVLFSTAQSKTDNERKQARQNAGSASSKDLGMISDDKIPIVYDTVFNKYISNVDGVETTFSGWSASDYIPVIPGKNIYFYTSVTSYYNKWYDSDKNPITSFPSMPAGKDNFGEYRYITPPSNAAYLRFSNTDAGMNGTSVWYPLLVINDSIASSDKTYSSEKINSLAYGDLNIILPSKCVAVAGSQFNIYNRNVIESNNLQNVHVYWTITPYNMQYDVYDDRLAFTPSDSDAGSYTITCYIKDKRNWNTVKSKTMSLTVLAKSAITGKSVVFIGDSLTNAGVYPYEIYKNLSEEGISSIGTRTSYPVFGGETKTITHEGRGGWSINDYITLSSKDGVTNAFWNPVSQKFDFGYWLSNNNFSMPDLVFLNLGTNGAYQYNDNIDGINEIITSIRVSSATVPILISLITPGATQDGFTYISHGSSATQFDVQQMTLVKRYITEYDGRESEYIYLSPVYFNLDRYHDFNTAEFAVSARNPELVTRQIDNVHPSHYGYLKFADVYWAMIQKLLS